MPNRTPEILALITKELGEQHLTANRLSMVQPGYVLDDDLGCNSIDRVCIAVAIDEAFGIEVSDDDVAKWITVQDVVETVERLAKREAA